MSASAKPGSLDVVRVSTASYFAKLTRPLVAVFTGGTSGIGEYTIHALARHAAVKHGAVIYIVGRSQSAADRIASEHADTENVTIHFVQADDLSLIEDVDRCCDELLALLRKQQADAGDIARIDLLVMSHADLWMGPRRETPEGLDKLMSLLYYSRIRFTQRLLPMLDATMLPSARVVSIYAGGMEKSGTFYPDDLSLRDARHFGLSSVRSHVVHMKAMAFETIAEQHPKIGLVHVYPGLVITPGFDRNPMPSWFKILWPLVAPLASWFSLAHDDSGEWTLAFISERFGGQTEAKGCAESAESSDGVVGGGAYSAKYDGTVYGAIEAYDDLRPKGLKHEAWQHTLSAFDDIGRGRKFEG